MLPPHGAWVTDDKAKATAEGSEMIRGPLRPTQTDDSAHLLKTQRVSCRMIRPTAHEHGILRTDDSAHIWLYGKPSHMRRAERSKRRCLWVSCLMCNV